MIPESLLDKLKHGDQTVIDPAIIAFMPRAEVIARAWGRKYPGKYDDIRSAAMLGIVKAINSVAMGGLRTDSINAYVDQTIREHIREFIRQDHLVYIPKDAFREQRKCEEPVPIAYKIEWIENDEENIESQSLLTYDIEGQSNVDAIFIEEFYDKLNNFEKIVLSMREEKMSLIEIAKAVGKSFKWIHITLERIQDKFIAERAKHGRESFGRQESDEGRD